MGCHCYFCRHAQPGELYKNRGSRNVRETKFNFRLPPLENNYLTGSPRGHYSHNMSHRTSGHSMGHANKHRYPELVTINGVNFDYGSYQHYKAYRRAHHKLRNKMDIVEPKREHAQRIEEPDTGVLNENENTCNKTNNIPHYEILENSI